MDSQIWPWVGVTRSLPCLMGTDRAFVNTPDLLLFLSCIQLSSLSIVFLALWKQTEQICVKPSAIWKSQSPSPLPFSFPFWGDEAWDS